MNNITIHGPMNVKFTNTTVTR